MFRRYRGGRRWVHAYQEVLARWKHYSYPVKWPPAARASSVIGDKLIRALLSFRPHRPCTLDPAQIQDTAVQRPETGRAKLPAFSFASLGEREGE